MHDVTKDNYLKKELYELIKTDESIFDFIQESSLDGLWYWDLENPENEWMNPKFWTVLGYNPDEMPHKSSAWQNIINQEDLKVAIDNFTKHCKNPNHPYDQIVRYTHKNGSTVWIRCRGLAIRDKDGKPIRMLGAHHDISEIKKKEHDLLEIEKRSSVWLENSPICTKIVDLDFNLQYMSQSGVKELKIDDISQFYGKPYPFYFYPDSFKIPMTKNLLEAKETGRIITQEASVVDIQGQTLWYHSTIVPVFNDNNKVNYIMVVSMETTKRKLAELELTIAKEKAEESEALYRQTFEEAPVGIAHVKANGQFIKMNRLFCEIIGYSKEELLSLNIENITYHEDLTKEEVFISKVLNNEIDTFSIEKRYIHKKGHLIWISLHSNVVRDKDNKVLFAIATVVDITDRIKMQNELTLAKEKAEEQEKKYRLITENTSDGIFTSNAEGKITYVSNSYLKQLGYSEEEELNRTAADIYNIIHPDERDDLFAKIYEAIKENKSELIYVFRVKHKNGNYIWREDHAKFNYDNSGKHLFSTVICRDITELKTAEQQKNKQLVFSKALNEIAEIIIENDVEDDLLEKVNQIIGKTLDLDRTLIYAISYEGNYILGLCEWLKEKHENISVTKGQYSSLEMFKDGFDEIKRTKRYIESHHNSINQNFLNNGSYKILHEQLHIKSLIWYPFAFDNHGYYLFTMNQILNERLWTLDDIQFLEAVAKQVTIALLKIKFLKEKKLNEITLKQTNLELISAKEIAEEREAELKVLFEKSPDYITITNLKGEFINCNDAALKFNNLNSLEEIKKYSTVDCYVNLHEREELIKELLKNGFLRNKEIRFKSLTTNYEIDSLVSVEILKSNDNEPLFITSIRDISIIKHQEAELIKAKEKSEESERKYRTIFDRSLVSILIADDKGNYLSANNSATQLLGYSVDEILKMNVSDLKTTVKPDAKERYLEYLAKGEETGEFDFMTKQGIKKIAFYHAVRIKPDFNLSMLVDITEKKKAETELLIAKEKAEESDRLKTAFLQNMSHEIRTPMNAIMGFSSLLAKNFNKKKKLEYYSKIIDQRCNDLLNIINDILDISKIESGQNSINLESCNINELFDEIDSFFIDCKSRLNKQHINLSFHSPEGSFSNIKTDKLKLKQVLINLITNALKFTETGSINCSCKPESDKLLFQVSDTGIGIPVDQFDYIFERFSQLKQTTIQNVGGTGLGLPIVKGLVELLGGKVWLESECNKGTTFFFTIDHVKVDTIPENAINFEFKQEFNTNKTILIVEDDIYNAEYLKEILNDVTSNIITVDNGLSAVKIVHEQKIDLVLMDIRLPDISGYEATQLILRDKPKIKIIAQTAYASNTENQKAIEAGCVDYISKPTKQEELLKMLKKYLS